MLDYQFRQGGTGPRRWPASLRYCISQRYLFLNLASIVFFLLGCVNVANQNNNSISSKTRCIRTEQQITSQQFVKYKKEPMVEFVIPGHFRTLSDALNIKLPVSSDESVALNASILNNWQIPEEADLHEHDIQSEDVNNESNQDVPRLFIGVTSDCCSLLGQERRKAIRETWKAWSLSHYTNVDIKFILSQPDEARYKETLGLLEEEVLENSDLVVVRGVDLYTNLPSKTMAMLKYAYSSNKQYTHILKTDDDCYVRVHKLLMALENYEGEPILENLYLGCIESPGGFRPVRNRENKWYLSIEEFGEDMAKELWDVKYLAGWGYVLSRDVAYHALRKYLAWKKHPDEAPKWFKPMKWEDVLIGALVSDKVGAPVVSARFKAAWRSCTNETAIRHLDGDAPLLLKGLYEQEISGLWDKKTVQCSTGRFLAGDYSGWRNWRNSQFPPDLHV